MKRNKSIFQCGCFWDVGNLLLSFMYVCVFLILHSNCNWGDPKERELKKIVFLKCIIYIYMEY